MITANHRQFKKHVLDSEDARWYVARWLGHRNYRVRVWTLTLAAEAADHANHVDKGDIYAMRADGVTWRVEVKERPTLDFTCAEDYPFRDGVIVCTCDSFDGADPQPYCYVILNRKWTHAAFILGSTCRTWRREWVSDPRYGENHQELDYIAPLSSVQFGRVNHASMKEIFPYQGDRPGALMIFPVVKEGKK